MSLYQHEEEQLKEDLDFLKELEDDLRNEDELRKRHKLEKQIKETKQKIREREVELNSLEAKDVEPKNQLFFEGCELLKNKNFDRAEDKFDEAKRLDTDSPEPWYWKAQVAIAKDNKRVKLDAIALR